MSKRDAILEGAQAAARLHETLGTRQAVERAGGGIDVFGALLASDAALLFRPLEGLLGFCIKGPDVSGVVVSTQRPLRIQRFTGAHELGHVVLGHTLSLDGEEILGRGALRDEKEIAADSFASSFLIPKWLLQIHAKRQGWNRASMSDPRIVYQLALRVGASYEATCVALERNNIIDAHTRVALVAKPRRAIKTDLLEGFAVDNFHPDVWLLTECDQGLSLEGQPDDIFILKLEEHGGSGYLWDTKALTQSGFAILRDERAIPDPENEIGSLSERALIVRGNEPASGAIELEQRRPWQNSGEPLNRFGFSFDLFGKEVGIPRLARRQMMAA